MRKQTEPQIGSGRPESLRANAPAVGLMILGLLAVYCPLALFQGDQALLGIDYNNIHERRIRYAQEALGAAGGHLPAWYTRELMGTPFWSNIQSFPLVPTRLAVFWLDPSILFSAAVCLAAILAALFTYLYLRKMELGRVASAVGGWTFAASGYFASRLLAGHLPLLEAFGALPLLLWCLESIARSDPVAPKSWRLHVGLAAACLCIVLCGHPQVPAYAMGTAVLYAIVRIGGRAAVKALAAMALGVGLSGAVWWPMLQLIGRSTRILPLDRAGNDLALPYWRLKAFLFPWADGWPSQVQRAPEQPFVDPNVAYFWDTVCYVGWIPILAALFLLGRALVRRRWPAKPWVFLAVVAAGAVLVALPFAQALTNELRVTLLRSPARLLYLTTFALAAAIAVLVDELTKASRGTNRTLGVAIVAVLVAVHAVDLGSHAREFVHLRKRFTWNAADIERLRRNTGPQRFAFDCSLVAPGNRGVDDVGFFDSLMLARPYRAFLALAGYPPTTNSQNLDGGALPAPALAGLCVKIVVTGQPRDDLKAVETKEGASLYLVPDPLPRATFLPDAAAVFLPDEQVLARFRDEKISFTSEIFLDAGARPNDLARGGNASAAGTRLAYDRPSSDEIVMSIDARETGYLRVMESWDEGWSAKIDGQATDLLVADTFAMAVRVHPGPHEVRLAYATPGARTGLALTAASAVLLALFAWRLRAGR
ncbi:MAG TPA: YfhO family protein [Planctomycetota bacterium]|nr:YfhO family protein [Planctomycetota bacterium]